MAANILKTTEIYGSLSVKDKYATYSNIGVASGNIIVPEYFQNQGTTDLNNLTVSGTLGIGRDANTNR